MVSFLENGFFQKNVIKKKKICLDFYYSFYSGIEECIKQKQWINEKDFEILGSQLEPNSNGSHISRLKHEKNVRKHE